MLFGYSWKLSEIMIFTLDFEYIFGFYFVKMWFNKRIFYCQEYDIFCKSWKKVSYLAMCKDETWIFMYAISKPMVFLESLFHVDSKTAIRFEIAIRDAFKIDFHCVYLFLSFKFSHRKKFSFIYISLNTNFIKKLWGRKSIYILCFTL